MAVQIRSGSVAQLGGLLLPQVGIDEEISASKSGATSKASVSDVTPDVDDAARVKQALSSYSTSVDTPRGHGAAFNAGVASEEEDNDTVAMLRVRSKADSERQLSAARARAIFRQSKEIEQMQALLGFQPRERPPRVLCVSRRHLRKNKYVDIVGEYHLDLVQSFGGVAVIIPRTTQTLLHLMQYLPMDGLLVAEGNDMSDATLQKYGCAVPGRLEGEDAQKFASDTEFDISKDELEFALMKFALEKGCPILGLCRGSQMLNVLRGGTLIGDIEQEVGSQIVHLLDGSDPAYDSHRHPIRVAAGTPLAEWFSDDLGPGSDELLVNSYHHQGVEALGRDLVGMAWAPDGVLEGFYDPTYDPEAGNFVVGLQFHPERMLQDYKGCTEVYEAFGRACWAYQRRQR